MTSSIKIQLVWGYSVRKASWFLLWDKSLRLVRNLIACTLLLQISACSDTPGSIATVSKKYRGYQVEAYNNPRLDRRKAAFTITGGDEPAGLFFRYPLSKVSIYRIAIEGGVEQGSVMLRIRGDDHEPQYISLTDTEGNFEFEYSGVGWIELMIYSDRAFRYRLTNLSIELCATCTAKDVLDARLKSRILAEVPELARALSEDHLLAAKLLTNWAAQSVDQGDLQGPVKRNTAWIEVMGPGWVQENVWDKDAGGSYCGGFAIFLKKVFALFGLDAFVITIGYPGTDMTHVSNIVVTHEQGRRRYYLFDPTFNGTFVDQVSGRFVNLESLFEREQTFGARDSKYAFSTHPVARTLILDKRLLPSFQSYLAESNSTAECFDRPEKNGSLVCRNFSFGVRYYQAVFEPAISQLRINPNRLMETLLSRAVIKQTWFESSEDAVDFKALLRRFKIPH